MPTRTTLYGCFLVLALPAAGASAADLARRGESVETDQVLCVAGCDSRVPVIVHERERPPGTIDLPPPRTKWDHVTWGVWCADGLGCRALGNLPIGRHRGHSTSTINVYVRRGWY